KELASIPHNTVDGSSAEAKSPRTSAPNEKKADSVAQAKEEKASGSAAGEGIPVIQSGPDMLIPGGSKTSTNGQSGSIVPRMQDVTAAARQDQADRVSRSPKEEHFTRARSFN